MIDVGIVGKGNRLIQRFVGRGGGDLFWNSWGGLVDLGGTCGKGGGGVNGHHPGCAGRWAIDLWKGFVEIGDLCGQWKGFVEKGGIVTARSTQLATLLVLSLQAEQKLVLVRHCSENILCIDKGREGLGERFDFSAQ